MQKINRNLYINNILIALLKSCRPQQWTKNILVFAALLFSFLFDSDIFLNCLYAFASFCCISSSIYLFNDIKDISKDKLHPKKKYRPIARGDLPLNLAKKFSFLLAIISLILGFLISVKFLIIIFFYIVIQLAYCIKLKKVPILDILCIASGFLLRAIAGVISLGIGFSPWFMLTIGLLALFIAVEKRKSELNLYLKNKILTRDILKSYSIPLLERYESLLASSTLISYSLWASGPSLNGAQSPWMVLSIPFVLVGIFRYQYISDPKISKMRKGRFKYISTENPELILLFDNGIRCIITGWLITVIFVGLFLYS